MRESHGGGLVAAPIYCAHFPMQAIPTYSIDPVAARRWARRSHAATPWLHEEVARRLADRLSWIRLPVQRWVHWAPVCGGAEARALLAAQYPDAECIEVQPEVQAAPSPAARPAGPWWHRLGRAAGHERPARIVAAPPEGAAQLVWANLLADQASEPAALLADWLRALQVEGFLMFSCFGPDTLQELQALYAEFGWPPPVQPFTDMHDWGDRLVTAGFADPVVDMERLTLTYDTPVQLLDELRDIGRNLHPGRFAGLRTPAWRERLLRLLDERLRPAPGEPLRLSFELIYGHALRPAPRAPLEPLRFTRRRGELNDSDLVQKP